ncbi:MAG: hypothetical protein E5W85_10000 [Mesorhizobium sp.]|nr:MAG: hypothetical protein E5W85_10000 [Mesorhizobium sp.]
MPTSQAKLALNSVMKRSRFAVDGIPIEPGTLRLSAQGRNHLLPVVRRSGAALARKHLGNTSDFADTLRHREGDHQTTRVPIQNFELLYATLLLART